MPLAYLPPILPQTKRADDLVLHMIEVSSGGERRKFAGVNRYANRGDPRWVPALPYARAAALGPGNWLLGEAASTGFVGIAQNLGLGEEAVGALAVVARQDGLGRWGLFDAINVGELVERLFYQAETWLFENTPEIASLSGPASLEPLTPPGLLVDGFDAWPAALLPYNPPYYPELIEAEGYERGEGWSAWRLDCPSEESPPRRDRAKPDHQEWQAVSTAYGGTTVGEEWAPGLTRWLAHLAGAASFPAHPHLRWTLTQPFRRAVVVTLQGPTGVGACFGIPDFAPALRLTGGRLFPIGYALNLAALRRARRLRVFPASAPPAWSAAQVGRLYRELAVAARRHGFRELVIAPIQDSDEKSAEALERFGARAMQRFAIFEKVL